MCGIVSYHLIILSISSHLDQKHTITFNTGLHAEVSVAAHVLVPTAVTTTIIRIMAAAAVVVLTYDVSLMTIVVRVVVATQNEVAPPEVDVS